jgi:hypothetical protein
MFETWQETRLFMENIFRLIRDVSIYGGKRVMLHAMPTKTIKIEISIMMEGVAND